MYTIFKEMIFDYSNILLGTGLFAFTYFYFYPKKVKKITTKILLCGFDFYKKFDIVHLYGNHFDSDFEDSESEDNNLETVIEEAEEEEYILLDVMKGENVETLKLYRENDFDVKGYDIVFLKNAELYKEITSELNFDLKIEEDIIDRQFLQIELVTKDDKKYDIHENISKYYINGNNLFSENFINYYMKKWYNVNLDLENYKVNIIDKNIKLLILDKEESLLLKDNNYIKMNKKDVNVDE